MVLAARRRAGLEATGREVEKLGRGALAVETDVTDPSACQAAVRAAVEEFGHLDVLVNNAGLGTAVPALRETPEQFRQVIDVNLLGAYWMAQAAAQLMPRGSAIVNIASVLGLVKSYVPQAAYAASKAGLIGLTRDLNQQWSGRRGIRVNAVAPGYFRSEMTRGRLARTAAGLHRPYLHAGTDGRAARARRGRGLPGQPGVVLHRGRHAGRRRRHVGTLTGSTGAREPGPA